MTSVNTNASATTALRTLQQTNKALETTQNRISTGLKIGEAKDNAAYWAISTTLKSDNKSLATVKDALGLGAATVDVAYQGLNKAKEVLDEIKSKLTAATQAGVNKDTVQSEIAELQKQLTSIASSSVFSGENWLSVNSGVTGYNASKEVVSSFARDANNAVTIGTIAIDTSTVALFDSNTDNTKSGIVDAAINLKSSDGRDLAVGGKAMTGSTQTGGIEVVTSAGTDAVKAKSVFTGTFTPSVIDDNDKITLSYTVDGTTSRTVEINPIEVKGTGFSTAGRIGTVDELALAVNNALKTDNRSDVVAINDGGKLALQRTEAGAARSVQVTAWAGTDATFTLAGGSNLVALATSALGTVGDTNVGAVYEVQPMTVGAVAGTIAVANSVSLTVGGGANGHVDTKIVLGAGGTLGTTSLVGKTATQVAVLMAADINADTRLNSWVSATSNGADIVLTYKEVGNYNASTFEGDENADATNNYGTATVTSTPTFDGATTPIKAKAGGTLTNGNTVFGDADDAVVIKFTDSKIGAATEIKITNADLVAANITDKTLTSDQNWADALSAAVTRMGLDSKYIVSQSGGKLFIEAKTAVHGQTITFDATTPISVTDADAAVQKQMGLSYSSDLARGVDAIAAKSVSGTGLPVGGITLDADDKIYFDVAVDGGASKLVTIDKAVVNDALKTASQAEARLGVFSATGLTASDTLTVDIKWNGAGGASTYTLSGLTERSTADELASKLNTASGFSTFGIASVENGRVVLRTNSVGLAASIEVTSVVNSNPNAASGGLAVSTVKSGANAIANADGKITNAGEMARVVQAALAKGDVTGVLVSTQDNALSFESTTLGNKGSVAISKVQGSSGANQMSVADLDISATGLATVNAKTGDEIKATISAYISIVNEAINKVTSAAANLGAAASRIDMQKSFVDTLMDTIDKGVGNLIDADLSEESTRLQALQTKQQLGVQALSIANAGTQSILRLFQ